MIYLEIEAKYTASEAQLTELMEADALGKYSLGAIVEQRVNDHYMDTANRDIRRGGYACRMREKNGKSLLTVKGLGGTEGAIHQREEYETEVQPDTLPQQWPDCPARDIVISLISSRPLTELCHIQQRRLLRPVKRGQRHVGMMSLDVVDMESAGRIDRTYEVEIEL